MQLSGLEYIHVDVFADMPLSGNGLAVFPDTAHLSTGDMQSLTIEMRMFESIFLQAPDKDGAIPARIFTMEEELDFAGHPLLGAAATLHYLSGREEAMSVAMALTNKTVPITSTRDGDSFTTVMDQGHPDMLPPLNSKVQEDFAAALNLETEDLHPELPMQVVSTGLPYLIIPLAGGLDKIRYLADDFDGMLCKVGASFAYMLHVDRLEGRTWDNRGLSEDIATGSAAGPVGAYLVHHGRHAPDTPLTLNQGRYLGRPSRITVTPKSSGNVLVSGNVRIIARGTFV